MYSALVLATRAGAPSPGGSQPTGHDWTCSTGTGASQHHSRHLPHTHRGGHVGSSQHKRIEHEQLPAAARAWSPIHTEPDFSVTALTPRTRVCGHRHHSAVQAESSKPKRQTCEGQIAKFRNLNSCVTRDTFVFFAAAAVAVWHGPGADGEKSNAACAGWVMRAACGARASRCARGGSREGDPEQGL